MKNYSLWIDNIKYWEFDTKKEAREFIKAKYTITDNRKTTYTQYWDSRVWFWITK